MPRRPQNAASAGRANLIVLLLTVLGLLVVAEIVLRFTYQPENLGTVIQYDSLTGWSLKPRSLLISNDRQRDLHYRIDVNSFGLREREFEVQKPPGRRRVLVLGDSFAFGSGVQATDRFSDVLNRTLPDDVEVINAGMPGWGNDQELLLYEDRLRALRPDVVLLQFTGGNDVVNNELRGPLIEEGTKPRFRCIADSLVLEPAEAQPPVRVSPARRVRGLLKKSRLLVFVKRRLEMRAYRNHARGDPSMARAGFEADRQLSHWSVYDTRGGPAMETAWKVTECILSRFAADCRADSADFVVFAFPMKIEADVPWREDLIRHTGVDAANFDFSLPYRHLEAFCSDHDIEFHYPIEEFREAASSDTLYFLHDSHPNARSNAIAADYLRGVLAPVLAHH